jgi:hypothetical protein
MKTFTDNMGRPWTVTVTVDTVKRVKSLLGVNLLDAAGGKIIEDLVGDPVLLCDVVFCVIKPEADAKSVSDQDFGQSMAGDAIDAATRALLEELIDFFPSPKRVPLRKAMEKLRAFEARAMDEAMKRLESPELDQRLENALSGLSGTSPASSASIPGHSP